MEIINNQKYQQYKKEFESGNYPQAKLLLEELLTGSYEIDINNCDMVIDYAICLSVFRDLEQALSLARKCQKILEDCSADNSNIEALKKSWEKICKIYARCSNSQDLMRAATIMQQKVGADVENSFLVDIAQICSDAKLPKEALIFCGIALTSDNLDADLMETIKKIRTICSDPTIEDNETSKSKGICQTYANYRSGGKVLSPGLVIQVSLANLDEDQKKKIPRDWARNKLFLIWKVKDNFVCAFPISNFKRNKNPNQPRIELLTVPGEKCLYLDLYKIPLSADMIPIIMEEILPDYFEQIIRTTYNELSHASKKEQLPDDSLVKQFLEDEKPASAQVGSRLIIGDEYYYVCEVDTSKKEYIVIPITYHYDIRIPQYFRIPFQHEGIKAIVDTKDDNKDKVINKLPKNDSRYINRFVVYNNIPYFIVEVSADKYVCYDIHDMEASKKLNTLLLPKDIVDACECCDAKTLANFFKAYQERMEKLKKKSHIPPHRPASSPTT